MTDRELLELAAKAYGLEKAKLRIEFNQWNPLADDGDALRLAVKLNLLLDVIEGASGVQALNIAFFSEIHHDDPYAATRRAIVCAAAEIGKGMK